jgi:hypothetical protein
MTRSARYARDKGIALTRETLRPWLGFEIKPQSAEESSSLVIAGAKRVWQEAWSRA